MLTQALAVEAPTLAPSKDDWATRDAGWPGA